MFIQEAPLATTATALHTGQLDLLEYIAQACERLEKLDVQLQAFLPEPDRRNRLWQEAMALLERYPDVQRRPPLYGVLVGVKDIYRVDGFTTQAGSKLPPEALAGAEASCITQLKEQGALILGKTVTAEFAYIDPGPTRNPHNLEHTPGGSSSGSAAAVAAGFCSLGLGSQTVGSAIRPAAYCGIVGFKPSYGRIPTNGIIPVSQALDHVGLFTQDVAGMTLAASLLCLHWKPSAPSEALPVLGVPVGPYLDQASPVALQALENGIRRLEEAGYLVKQIAKFDDIKTIAGHHFRLMEAEAADNHRGWFTQYESLYSPRIAGLIREGQTIENQLRLEAIALQKEIRSELEALMKTHDIDLWLSPATTGPAPYGIESTGDSAMNLPWTFVGFPTIALPAGKTSDGLPLGLQFAGAFMKDEQLLQWSHHLAEMLAQ